MSRVRPTRYWRTFGHLGGRPTGEDELREDERWVSSFKPPAGLNSQMPVYHCSVRLVAKAKARPGKALARR